MSTWAPADSAPEALPDSTAMALPVAQRWSLAKLIGFRFAFCYLGGYAIFNGNATVFGDIPVLGYRWQDILAHVFRLPAQYLAGHLFHVPPPGNQLHPTGSGDTAIDWIVVLQLVCVSIIAAAIWSVLDRRRPEYRTLNAWLRFLVRFTVAVGLVSYGLDKVFPLQMAPPSAYSLSEPLGMHAPMSYLWEFIGLHPLYEMICGATELLAGILLLFRRTALAGAILATFVVTNVLLYNLFFDVPVKIYSGHLLLLSVFLILPDAKPLLRFFWLHQAAAPSALWAPPANRRWFRRTVVGLEVAIAVLALGGGLLGNMHYWRNNGRITAEPCALCRTWKFDATTNPVPRPFNNAAELAINTTKWAIVSDAAGKSTSLQIQLDSAHCTLEIEGPGKNKVLFKITQPDATHLTLISGNGQGTDAPVTLTDMTPPGGYLLMNRGFHWISEYPYLH